MRDPPQLPVLVCRLDPRLSARLVSSRPLPMGPKGPGVFEGEEGKRRKRDLEACATVSSPTGEVFLAMGSGSRPTRESVVLVRKATGEAPWDIRAVSASALYRSLRNNRAFAGSELNVEGVAALPGGVLRLFQRGNGAPRRGLLPVNATGDLEVEALLAWLARPVGSAAPPLSRVIRHDLGQLEDVPLTFTAATAGPGGRVLYLACAERSPDSYRDGEVVGSAVGVLWKGQGRWTPLRDAGRMPVREKVEGMVLDPEEPRRAWACTDPDDPGRPGALLEVRLEGGWWSDPPETGENPWNPGRHRPQGSGMSTG